MKTIVFVSTMIEVSAADAHLIAAAPNLYEALLEIQSFCDDPDGSEKRESLAMGLARLLPAARTALAKARGEPQ